MKVLIDVMNENFATKSDLKELELALKTDVKALETSMHTRFKEVETSMNSRFKDFETSLRELDYRLTIKLGAMLTVAVGVTTTLFKLLQGLR